MLKTFWKILIFCIPFIFFLNSGSFLFEQPKVLLSTLLLSVILFLTEIKSTRVHVKKFTRPLLIITAIAFFNLLLSRSEFTFFGNPYRLQGTFYLFVLMLIAYSASKIKVTFGEYLPFIALILLFIATLIIGLDLSDRAIGTFGEPNSLAAFTLFLWPFTLGSKKKGVISLLLTFIIIFLTGSRSALLGLVIQLTFYYFSYFGKSYKKALIISAVLLFTGVFGVIFDFKEKYEDRKEIWKTSAVAISKKPILGYGFGNGEYAIRDTAIAVGNNIQYVYVDSSHNVFLDWTLAGGTVTLFTLIWILFTTFKNYVQSKNLFRIMSLVGILTVMNFNPVSVVILNSFWFLIGNSFSEKKD